MWKDRMKYTPWFPVLTPPVREGLYQVRFQGTRGDMLRYWKDGKWFVYFEGSEPHFYESSFGRFGDQWRGRNEP